MKNTISTSADKIVEKYQSTPCTILYNDEERGACLQEGLITNYSATRCAILEVEACIELLKSEHVRSVPHVPEQLLLILAELKSRIV